jgi:hypothetical protein
LLEHATYHADRLSAERGRLVRWSLISDTTGMGLQHASLPLIFRLKPTMPLSDLYYPELIGHMQIINAPPVIYWAWKMVKHLLSKATQARVSITDKANTPRGLMALAPLKHLPPCWGGACGPVAREQYDWFLPRGSTQDLRTVWDNNALAAALQQLLRRSRADEPPADAGEAGLSADAAPAHSAGESAISDDQASAAALLSVENGQAGLAPRAEPEARSTPISEAEASPAAGGRVVPAGAEWAQAHGKDGVQLMGPQRLRPGDGSGAQPTQADRSRSGGDGGEEVAEALGTGGAEQPAGTDQTPRAAKPRLGGRSRCLGCGCCL